MGTKSDDIEGLEIPNYRAREFKLPNYHALKKDEVTVAKTVLRY